MHGSYSVVLFSLVTGSRRFDFGEPPDLEGRYPLLEDDFQGYYGQSPGHVSPPKQGTSLLNDLFPASGPTANQIYEWRRDHGSPPEDRGVRAGLATPRAFPPILNEHHIRAPFAFASPSLNSSTQC